MHDSLEFFTIRERNAQAATVTMTVEGKELVLEVDTGASVTVIPNKMFKEKLGHLKLRLILMLGPSYLYVEKLRCM